MHQERRRWQRRWSNAACASSAAATESHLMLVDLRAKKITGKDAEAVLQKRT